MEDYMKAETFWEPEDDDWKPWQTVVVLLALAAVVAMIFN